jgi:hypothetical protein
LNIIWGIAPHEIKGRNSGNNRNGYTAKRLKGDHGEIEIKMLGGDTHLTIPVITAP